MHFVEHHVVTEKGLPPYTALLYDYLIGSNGVFLRSERCGLAVILPVSSCEIRGGLAKIEPMVRLEYPRVPAAAVHYMLDQARAAHNEQGQSVEMLFHLCWRQSYWDLVIPEQRQTATSVVPLDDGPDSSYAQALIELHSHHRMQAFFSGTDDQDEQGFRIYAVIGRIFTQPALLVRVGCEGIHWIIPAASVFELPEEIVDVSVDQDHNDEEEDLRL